MFPAVVFPAVPKPPMAEADAERCGRRANRRHRRTHGSCRHINRRSINDPWRARIDYRCGRLVHGGSIDRCRSGIDNWRLVNDRGRGADRRNRQGDANSKVQTNPGVRGRSGPE